MMRKMNIGGNRQFNKFDIQPVGRFSSLIQTCLLPKTNHEISKHDDNNLYSATEEVAFWGGLHPKQQGRLIEKIPIYSFFLEWCTHLQESRDISAFSV
ncbi:hypothetical protein ACFVS2_26250 [Brevibacillus sp. NPDC058079]|uniref:hypothetical protein n=1 Tax=Brevibacillus sp. NPDC058079 TaxID=3346330 RepID=UPI0036EDBC5E